jgi:hypothetical protein
MNGIDFKSKHKNMPAHTIHLYALAFERSMRTSAVQHGIAGLLLLFAGIQQLQESSDAHPFFAWLSIIAGAVVLVAVIFELRSLRKHEHTSFGWVDFFSAPVLLIEAFHKLHLGKKYLPYPYFFLALVMLVRGFLYERLLHLRQIKLNETGLSARVSPLRKIELQWRDVREVTCADSRLEIALTNGDTRVIELKNIRNKEEAQNEFMEFYRRLKTAT